MEEKSSQVSQNRRKLFLPYHDGSVYFRFVNLITVNVDLTENISVSHVSSFRGQVVINMFSGLGDQELLLETRDSNKQNLCNYMTNTAPRYSPFNQILY